MSAGPDVADHQRERAAALVLLAKKQSEEIHRLRSAEGSAVPLLYLSGGALIAFAFAWFSFMLTGGEVLAVFLIYGAGLMLYARHKQAAAREYWKRTDEIRAVAERANLTLPLF